MLTEDSEAWRNIDSDAYRSNILAPWTGTSCWSIKQLSAH